MILTQQHIQRLLSNHAVIQVVPQLLPFVEEIKAIRERLSRKAGCSSCKERSELEPTLRRALSAVVALPPDRLAALAKHLGATKLFTYLPQSDGKPGLVQLGA